MQVKIGGEEVLERYTLSVPGQLNCLAILGTRTTGKK